MTLKDIEKTYEIKFPVKWWEIYSKGMMEWMEIGTVFVC